MVGDGVEAVNVKKVLDPDRAPPGQEAYAA